MRGNPVVVVARRVAEGGAGRTSGGWFAAASAAAGTRGHGVARAKRAYRGRASAGPKRIR